MKSLALYIVIIALLIIVIIFGLSSGAQSYATAQQAQAQIETAKVAQVSAWGNLITILTLALVIIFVLMLIAGVISRFAWQIERSRQGAPPRQTTPHELPAMDANQLLQLMTLKMLMDMNGSKPQISPPSAPKEEESVEELFPWLR